MPVYSFKMPGVIARLMRSAKGATLPMMAAGVIPMIAALGGAVDIGRIYITRSQMQAGADAAALAAANAYDNASETDANGRYKQAVAYYLDNVPNGYMGLTTTTGTTPYGTSTTLLKPTFSQENGISKTVVTATGSLPMTFMKLFGFQPHQISVTATAEFQPHPLEVMVVLDNTGSMDDSISGKTKMAALKEAMHNFLNVLYQGADTQPNVAIGIINYTIAANVGGILKQYGVTIESMPGFTDRDWAAGNNLGWKGCVVGDKTMNTMTANSVPNVDQNSYDIWLTLPDEKPTTNSFAPMPPIKPFLYPQTFIPASWTVSSNPTSNYYKSASGTNYAGPNLYKFPSGEENTLANSWTFKRGLYRLYKALNNGAANMSDDVIVAEDGVSYYDTSLSTAYNDETNVGTNFYVRWNKIPNLSEYLPLKHYDINKTNVDGPTPNFQCPEPGIPIDYGRTKSYYDDYVDKRVWPVKPANGTMHHAGFIWGWRLLARPDVFRRTPPTGSGEPRRALVFMTDGLLALNMPGSGAPRIYGEYGAVADKLVATTADVSKYLEGAKIRFTKACAAANTTPILDTGETPLIFTVAINRGSDIDSDGQTRLSNCGTSGYWLTTNPTDLNNAFAQIARTLTDVHLTK
ncbi:TadE/TadG family type IV pilus assembly protein [Sphingobium sp. CR28]|uniref:TadE/TadG family type IV pilus assembly protein n=1 Tax=Sphingobium sp. CR28 TaxID=3400272 RepID=UPI003FEFCEA1